MNNLSSAEKNQQLAVRTEEITRFLERNVCDNIKTYIFGGTKVVRYTKRISDYVVYINNIFSLAFIFAYGCLRCDNDRFSKPINLEVTKQSSLRIINSLRKAYVQYPVTSELIQFVLTDIQFEMKLGEGSELIEMFQNMWRLPKDFSLIKYYKVIANWRVAPSRFNMDSNELSLMFQNLLKAMTFLREYELVQDEHGFAFVNKESLEFGSFQEESYEYIDVGRQIYYNPDQSFEMYSLYSVEKLEEGKNKELGLRYVVNEGFKSISFVVTADEKQVKEDSQVNYIVEDPEDYYYSIFGEDWDLDERREKEKNVNFINQIHAINYKYIKNLALSISDSISVCVGAKQALYDAYSDRYKDIFKTVQEQLAENNNIESLKIDWDSIIVMLLIESSPSSVLETLFVTSSQLYIDICKNLCKRIDNEEMIIYGKSDTELLELVSDIKRSRLVWGEAEGFGKIPRTKANRRLSARIEALIIMSALSKIFEEENVEKVICAGNIYDNIFLLKKMSNETAKDQTPKYVTIILAETFRHLICFYKGLLGYGEIKTRFDAESCNKFFSEKQLAVYQKELHGAFIFEAKKQADVLKKYNSQEYGDMIAMINEFIELCENCSSLVNSSAANRQNLFSVLGKHDILDVAELKSTVKTFVADYNEINESNVNKWINFALDILKYLKTGNFKKAENDYFHAIYPFVATYNKGNENYDGYKTVTFTLNIDSDSDGEYESKDYINVLTEFTYNLSDIFYCLPNVLRSNKKWWIDPLLINFKEFNDIFID